MKLKDYVYAALLLLESRPVVAVIIMRLRTVSPQRISLVVNPIHLERRSELLPRVLTSVGTPSMKKRALSSITQRAKNVTVRR